MKKVEIKGVIVCNDYQQVYDYYGIDATSPLKVSKQIGIAQGDTLNIEINSGGGDIFAGSEIYTMIKSYQGHKEVNIVGLAASSASVIAMSGDKVKISPTGQFMMHNVSAVSAGDYRDMDKMSEELKIANDGIANAYMIKTNKGREEILDLMDKETWLSATKAVELGFADEVMFVGDNSPLLVASAYTSQMLPQEVVNKTLALLTNVGDNNSDVLLNTNKLNLLKLKGVRE